MAMIVIVATIIQTTTIPFSRFSVVFWGRARQPSPEHMNDTITNRNNDNNTTTTYHYYYYYYYYYY